VDNLKDVPLPENKPSSFNPWTSSWYNGNVDAFTALKNKTTGTRGGASTALYAADHIAAPISGAIGAAFPGVGGVVGHAIGGALTGGHVAQAHKNREVYDEEAAKTTKPEAAKKPGNVKVAVGLSGLVNSLKGAGRWIGGKGKALADSGTGNAIGHGAGFGLGYTGSALARTANDPPKLDHANIEMPAESWADSFKKKSPADMLRGAATNGAVGTYNAAPNPATRASILERLTDTRHLANNIFAGVGASQMLGPASIKMDWLAAAQRAKKVLPRGTDPNIWQTLSKYTTRELPVSFIRKGTVAAVPDIWDNVVKWIGASRDTAQATSHAAQQGTAFMDDARSMMKDMKRSVEPLPAVTNNLNTAASSVNQAVDKLTQPTDASKSLTSILQGIQKWGPTAAIGAGIGIPATYLLGQWLANRNSGQPEKKKSPIGAAGSGGTAPINNTRLKAPRLTLKKPGNYTINYQDDDIPDQYPGTPAQ